jgi:hypothetical protein
MSSNDSKVIYKFRATGDRKTKSNMNSKDPHSPYRAHATSEGVGHECRDGEENSSMHACR